MADSAVPLLTKSATLSAAAATTQILQAILVSLAWAFDAQQTFIDVFTDADPSWHCTDAASTTCSSASTPCDLPSSSWDWDLPPHTSIVSEWSLQCFSPFLIGLPASAYFVGCLVGGLLLATLADSILGRKRMLFLSCLTMSLSGVLTVFSPNIWTYAALRFICGFARSTVGTSALVLTTETVTEKWREHISIVGFFCFSLGFLSLPAIAYTIEGSSWRNLYLWISVPSFFYSILIHFFVEESPRWLSVSHRRASVLAGGTNVAYDIFGCMKILWSNRWTLRRLVLTMIVGFGVGTVYYGIPLNVGNLGSNLYLSVTFNALAELPASLITFFLIGKLNRRSLLLVFTTLSALCSVMCVFFTTRAILMVVEVVAFFAACTSFNVLLIYSTELFPTCVRNSAISMVRQALVLGGVFAPMLVAEGRRRSELAFGVFGLVIGCCGLFIMGLPETRGGGMSDTMEEHECKEVVSYNQNP